MSTAAMDRLEAWNAADFLKKVTDVVPSVIYIFNQQTQANEYTNRSLGVSLGYSSEEIQKMGADLMPQILHPDDLMVVGEHFSAVKELADGEVRQVEYRVRHKCGDWVWLVSHDTVFDRDASGAVLRHIGVAADITPQKRAEEQARAEHLIASTTNDELRAFSYSLSHDMKAPSNTLQLLLNELLDSHGNSFDADARELIDLALGTVARMGALVDDVLNYTRVINQETREEPVPLAPLLQDIVADLRALIHESGAEIEVASLPAVLADPTQMRILFKNLVENAIKFRSPDRPCKVRVCCAQQDATHATLAVSDNGIGIAPDKHGQIFTIFKRLNANSVAAGTGLGLAICRRIAANHAGQITLTSEPDQGATFSIRLATA